MTALEPEIASLTTQDRLRAELWYQCLKTWHIRTEVFNKGRAFNIRVPDHNPGRLPTAWIWLDWLDTPIGPRDPRDVVTAIRDAPPEHCYHLERIRQYGETPNGHPASLPTTLLRPNTTFWRSSILEYTAHALLWLEHRLS